MVNIATINTLPEIEEWADIPRLENGWWPTGGAVDPANDGGIMNWQAQVLLNRTAWLKAQLAAGLDPVTLIASLLDADGPGTGLDADLVDGKELAEIMADVQASLEAQSLGFSQTVLSTWDGTITRVRNTNYLNATGRPIVVCIGALQPDPFDVAIEVSADGGVTWATAARTAWSVDFKGVSLSAVIPNNVTYRLVDGGYMTDIRWSELR